MAGMAVSRAIRLCALLVLLAGGVSCGTATGRFFRTGLPLPLQPFIDFYEIHLDPENFQSLSGVPRLVAAAMMTLLVVLANLGHLPVSFGANSDQNKLQYQQNLPPGTYGALVSRHGRAVAAETAQTFRLDSCVMRLLCELDINHSAESSTKSRRDVESTVLRNIFRRSDRRFDDVPAGTDAGCSRWRSLCSVTEILRLLRGARRADRHVQEEPLGPTWNR